MTKKLTDREKYLREYGRKYKRRTSRTEPGRRYYPPTDSDIPMHGWRPYSDVHRERISAHEKHAEKPGGSMEMKCYDNPDWLSVLVEEVGEVSEVLNDFKHGLLNSVQRKIELRAELVQVAAMAVAWIDAIDLDERKP